MGKIFGFIGTLMVAGIVFYLYTAQMKNLATPEGGNNPKATVNIVGVKTDLVGIAHAEQQYYVSEGHYGSLNDLTSGHYITVSGGRAPYTYDVETTPTGFEVTASRNDGGSPAELSIDESMQIQATN